MGWARVDDNYPDHPKILAAGPLAELLDVRGIIYCARHETDGFIHTNALHNLGIGIPAAKRRAAKLVEVGRWEVVDDGWMVHDFLEFHPSKAQKAHDREIARLRSEMYRNGLAKAVRDRDGDSCQYCAVEVNWKDRKGKTGAVFEHVIPASRGGDTTIDNLVVACRRCNEKKGARTPEEAGMKLIRSRTDLDLVSRTSGTGRESLSLSAESCSRCDSTGWMLDPQGNATKCDHLPPLRAVGETA